MYFWKLPLFSRFFIFVSRLDQKVHRVKSGVVLRLGKGQKFETSDSSRFLTHFDSGESMEWIRHLECILTQKLEILRPSVHSFFVTYYGDILPQTPEIFRPSFNRFLSRITETFCPKVLTAFSSRPTETFCPSVGSFFFTNFEDILAHLWWLEFARKCGDILPKCPHMISNEFLRHSALFRANFLATWYKSMMSVFTPE